MKTSLILFPVIIFLGIFSPIFCQWEYHIIDSSITSPAIADVGDLDLDGDLDVAATAWGNASVYYYINNWPDTTWNKYLLDNTMGYPVGLVIADIDGDLTLDIVAGAGGGDKLVWYKNLGGNPINWDPHIIDSDANGIEVIYVEDMDSDNDEDITACVRNANQVCWYENLDGNGTNWRKDTIDANIVQPVTCRVFDIDEEEDMDVVANGRINGEVVWYMNLDGTGHNWEKDTIDVNGIEGTFTVDVGDIDNDSHLDVAVTGYHQNNIYWCENSFPDTTWSTHIIDTGIAEAWVLELVDVDLDLDLDIMATGREEDKVMWYENILPDTNWNVHYIDSTLDGAANITSADMDFDGDSDAVVTAWGTTNQIRWYENPLNPTPVITIDPETLNFGEVGINNDSTMIFTITNIGNINLEVTNISSNEPAFTVNITSDTIPPGSNQDVEVTFTPTNMLSYNGIIEISHNAVSSPDSVTVSGSGVTGIADELLNTIPNDFIVYPNYPNPFNPTTFIIFGLPEASEVILTLFNSLGEEVTNLFKGYKNAGYQKVEFNAENLPSGVYFYRLKAGSFVETKKMVLMK